MKKKIVLTMVAMVAAVSLMGCNVTTTSTYTETTTDADGNTTTTTTTTTNGETTTETTESGPEEEVEEVAEEEAELTVATITFENETDFDFAELYFALSASDNWGDEILGEDAPLAVGEYITYPDALTYSEENSVWDIKAVDADGNNVEFNGADMLASSDPTNIYITIEYDSETQSYSASMQ